MDTHFYYHTFQFVYNDALSPYNNNNQNNPIRLCCLVCLFFIVLVFVTSTITKNYSQVDKLWSILPVLYSWIVVTNNDTRTFVMAILVSIWGIRLTYNFYRKGGYNGFPYLWNGDEDYRWSYIQKNNYIPYANNSYVWMVFNFVFISIIQNILLMVLVAPSMVAYTIADQKKKRLVSNEFGFQQLNWIDFIAIVCMLLFILLETIADNQQYAYQTEKYRRIRLQLPLGEEYAIGFCRTGLFQYVCRPNFISEQAIWVSYYIFSVAATYSSAMTTNERSYSLLSLLFNWSIVGCVALIGIFYGSGILTDRISREKYPLYEEYTRRVPRYIPRFYQFNVLTTKPYSCNQKVE